MAGTTVNEVGLIAWMGAALVAAAVVGAVGSQPARETPTAVPSSFALREGERAWDAPTADPA
jgi:hypothetical protein